MSEETKPKETQSKTKAKEVKPLKLVLAAKYSDVTSRFVIHFERKDTVNGVNTYKKEIDFVFEPVESGATNHLLVNSKGLPWGTHTFEVNKKVKRRDGSSSDVITAKDLITVLVKSRANHLMRGDIKIVVADEIRKDLAEVMKEHPGVLDDRNFVNDRVLQVLDFNINTTVAPIMTDNEVTGMEDIEKKIAEANKKAQESITTKVV